MKTGTVGNFYAPVDKVNNYGSTQCAAPSFRSEEELEAAIEAAKQRMCAATTREEKLRHWRDMVRFIDQRTPARRQFMARVQGL